MPLLVKQVIYHGFGDPDQVLSLQETMIYPEDLGSTEVLVRWLAAPVNPSDLMQISGEYGMLPTSFPTVAGNVGCGVVEKVGSKVTDVKVGGYVIPQRHLVGTWRTYGINESAHLIPFGKGLPTSTVATIILNPPTAYRLLKDFVDLKKGDVVVQNGANSEAGKYVIQLAHLWGFKTVNVVRDRPTIADLKAELKEYGADEVYTEEEFETALPELSPAQLALDCVGGKSALLLSSTLAPGGTLVNYGAMAAQPLQVSPHDLIFRNIKVVGFWLGTFYEETSAEDCASMLSELAALFAQSKLRAPPHTEHRLEDFAEAVKASRAATNSKHFIILSNE